MNESGKFADRREAGRRLARALRRYSAGANAIVLGLPRGGIVVAGEVAKELGAPLDALCVRKIGLPAQPEVAMGAVAPGGVLLIDHALADRFNVAPAEVRALARKEREELKRRESLYRKGRLFPGLDGKTAIVVDDGIATGFTMCAALLALKQKAPARIVVAAPVCAASSCKTLKALAHEIVCLSSFEAFDAIGQWYENFAQASDEEVVSALEESRRRLWPGHRAA